MSEKFVVSTIRDYIYTGKAITQKIVLKDGNKTLAEGVDYKVEFLNNKNAGTAYIIIEGAGSYSGSIVKRFEIKKKAVTNAAVILEKSKYKYTGRSIKPDVTVKYGNKLMVKNVDYTVAYSNNLNMGKATAVITFINNYSGKATKTFLITPLKVKGQKQSVSNAKNVTIKWNKIKGVSGYEVYRATRKNGTYKKVKTIKGNNPKFKQSKLKSSTTYYYKIRAYKKVGKTYIYGEYSNVLSARTRPAAPKAKVVSGKKRAEITWNKVARADGYEVYMSTSKGGKYTKISTKKASVRKIVKKGLRSNKKYYFKVRTYSKMSGGKKVYSKYSKIISVKIK